MSTETAVSDNVVAQGKNFVWHEVYGPSSQVAIDFYTQALGFGSHAMEMGEMGTYHMLTRGGVPVAGVVSTDNDRMRDVPPHWSTYLAGDDVDASLAKCQEHGATVTVPPMDVPTVGRMALIQDPQGAHIWIFTPNPNM